MITFDIETCPIKMSELPPENKAYLEEKSKNKRSGKIIDGDIYGKGAIGRWDLNEIICCCTKIDDKEIVSRTGEEKDIINAVFKVLVSQDHVIGFNSNSFDLPMLKMRGIINGIHTCMPFNIKSWDEHYRDVRFMLTDQYGIGNLAYFCRVFKIAPPRWELEDKSNLGKYPIEQVVKGCKEDVRATYELYNLLNDKKENK